MNYGTQYLSPDPGTTQLASPCSWDCQLWILTAIGRQSPALVPESQDGVIDQGDTLS